MSHTAGASVRPYTHLLPVGFHTDPNAAPVADAPAAADAAAVVEPARTFTQQDVDRIVQERLARAKTQPPDDYEDLKQKAQLLDEIEQQNKSELEKAVERAEKAEAEKQQALEAANRRLVEAAVLSEASALNAIKPEHMFRLIDTGQVTVGDDGQVIGARDAVKGFLEANPEYVGRPASGGADQGARGSGGVSQLTRDQLQTMSPAEIVQAKNEGRLNDVLGIST